MTKVSSSPERNTFQKEAYLERCKKDGKEPSEAYLEMWENTSKEDAKWAEEEHKNNLEYDLRTTEWVLEKARANDYYAQNIYAALCNMRWCKRELWPVLAEEYWSCSWRYAGGIVADMLGKGDYIDWYCSGMGGLADYDTDPKEWAERTKYVGEGVVTDEIAEDFSKLGWFPVPYKDEELI